MDATERPETLLEKELLPGERVLWSGRPSRDRRDEPRDRMTAFFTMAWAGFLLTWWTAILPAVLRGDASPLLLLATLPHVCVGVWLTKGRDVFNARLRQRLFYAVTDRRVVELERRRGRTRVNWADLSEVRRIDRTVRDDGSGSVMFHRGRFPLGARRTFDRRTNWGPARGSAGEVLFYEIDDARRVLELVGERWEPPRRPDWLPTSAWRGTPPAREPQPGEGPDVTGARP